MAKRCRILCCLALLIGFPIASQLFAQQNEIGKIIGSVRVLRGDFPSHPILVSLQMRGAEVQSSYTDDRGAFGFYNLMANEYSLTVNDEAYEPATETTNLDPSLSTTNVVQFTLVPRTKSQKDPLNERVQGSNPYLIDPADYYRKFPKKTLKEFQKGVDDDHNGKVEDAIQHYAKALSYSPDFYPAHNNLGSDYLARRDFENARSQFEAAVTINKNDPEGHLNLGNVYLATQHFPEAEREIQEGLQRYPDSSFGLFLQGSLYLHTGRPELAEKSLQSAIAHDPKMSQARLQLINVYLQQKRTEDAVAQLQSYLKEFPDTPFSPKARDLLKRLQSPPAAASK